MPPVGTQRECGVPQAAQIAHRLTVIRTAKLGALQDSFFELCVCDLAFRRSGCNAQKAQECDSDWKSCTFHMMSFPCFCFERSANAANATVASRQASYCRGTALS